MEVLKQRVERVTTFTGRSYTNGKPTASNGINHSVGHVAQTVLTADHPFHLLKQKNRPRMDVGGEFESLKLELTTSIIPQWYRHVGSGIGGYDYEFYTVLMPSLEAAQVAKSIGDAKLDQQIRSLIATKVAPGYTRNELTALGAKAIATLSPLNPVADTATTFAEFLSERKFFAVPGKAGSLPGEYLNYMFGIAPTVGYAQDLRNAIKHKDKHLDQLHRDSGKWIRRRGDFNQEVENTYTRTPNAGVFAVGPSVNFYIAPTGVLHTTTKVERRAWFSGAFTYYLPESGERRRLAELDKLYGVKPGVDTAWELLPYSWLVDYKTSAGSVLQNLNSFGADGLVMPYGYIMGQQVTMTHYRWEGQLRGADGTSRPTVLEAQVVKTTKQRLRASPFGFGILPGDLNNRQLSILAALGLTWLR